MDDGNGTPMAALLPRAGMSPPQLARDINHWLGNRGLGDTNTYNPAADTRTRAASRTTAGTGPAASNTAAHGPYPASRTRSATSSPSPRTIRTPPAATEVLPRLNTAGIPAGALVRHIIRYIMK